MFECYSVEMIVLVNFVWAVLAASYAQESKLVQISQGPVKGYKAQDADVFEFFNIPYATAPTGPQRFKAPLSPPTWVEPLEAKDRLIVCPQRADSVPAEVSMQEDCLVANVYVPDTNATSLPVMVNIHGGAFQGRYGGAIVHKQMVNTKKVIAVTFNYRLGVHGFLCLGTEDIPGNAGMKDQVALLRWVKQNIAFFGGNPDDVTIAGCSAGGVSADLLMLSKTTKGLFNKVIALSGSNIGVFGIQKNPVQYAMNQARIYKFDNADNINALEEFYKTASYELLASDNQAKHKHSGVVFSPCIERDVGQEIFLEMNPVDILKSGDYVKYPVLYGFADREGIFRVPEFDTWKEIMNKNFSEFLPVDLTFSNNEEKEVIATKVKEFYFGDKPIGNDDVLKYIDYFTDVIFVYSMLRSVTLQVEAGNHEMYLHVYSFVHNNLAVIPHTEKRGATHCAQSHAAIDEDESIISDEYRNMKSIMREVWLNFITTGNPTPESSALPRWIPANAERSPIMSFGSTVELVDSVMTDRAKFWDDIYARYYQNPIAPTNTANWDKVQ